MLLQSVVICFALLLVAFAFGSEFGESHEIIRMKRNLDFGVFLRNLLQKSADLSGSSSRSSSGTSRDIPIRLSAPSIPRIMSITTTTTTTTTTPAPPRMIPPVFLQKTFYKTFPNVGGLGFGFGFSSNLENQPIFFPYNPRGGYINFDIGDGSATMPPNTASTAPSMTTPMISSTTQASMTPTQNSTSRPASMRRKQRPIKNNQRKPALPALPPNTQQPSTNVIYQYVPVQYLNSQAQVQTSQPNFENTPFYNVYNAPKKNRPPSYAFPSFYKTHPAGNEPVPVPVIQSPRPIIASPVGAFNNREQSTDNLNYQFTLTNDIYSKGSAPNSNNGGVAVDSGDATNSDVEASDDTADTTNDNRDAPDDDDNDNAPDDNDNAPDDNDNTSDDNGNVPDVNDDGGNDSDSSDDNASPTNDAEDSNANNGEDNYYAANILPTNSQNDASINYVDNSVSPDVSGPFPIQLNTQSYGYDYDDEQNEVPYSLKNSASKQGFFLYKNQLNSPVDEFSSHDSGPVARNSPGSFSSMHFRTPFARFGTSTFNNGRSNIHGQQFQRYPTQQKYY